jgi:hypothetical protein
MSKVNDYNDKCMEQIFTERDSQEELRQKEYDLMTEALYDLNDTLSRYAKSLDIARSKGVKLP